MTTTNNNKAQVGMKTIIISVVIACFVIVAFYSIYASLAYEYGVSVNETFANESFNKIGEINAIAEDVGTSIDSSEATVTDSVVSFLTLPFKALKITFKSFDIILTLASELAGYLFVDNLIYTLFITLALIVIVFAIISALLSRS